MSKKRTTIEVWACVCERCEHSWNTKGLKIPDVCPRCKNPNWDKPTKRGFIPDKITFPPPMEGQTGWEIEGIGKFGIDGSLVEEFNVEEKPITKTVVELLDGTIQERD